MSLKDFFFYFFSGSIFALPGTDTLTTMILFHRVDQTLIFTKTTFGQHGNTKRMAHILVALDQLEHPSKAPIMLQNIVSMRYHYFGAHFTDTIFCHEKDALNVIIGCFTT